MADVSASLLYCVDRPYVNTTLGGAVFRNFRMGLDLILILTILVVNVFVILAINLYRRAHRGSAMLHNSSVSMKFVLLLAISDVLVGLCVPVYLVPHYWCDINDIFRPVPELCMLKYFASCFSSVMSNTSLIAIAVDRYIAVVHTLRYRAIMTTKTCHLILTAVILFSLFTTLVLFFYNSWVPGSYCEFEEVVPLVYVTVLASFCHVSILGSVFATHYQLHRRASQSVSQRHIYQDSAPSECKSVRVLLLVTGAYFFCWTPYSVCLMIRIANSSSPYSPGADFAFQFTFPFSLANSALNPFLYAWKHSEIRSAVKWFLNKCRLYVSAVNLTQKFFLRK